MRFWKWLKQCRLLPSTWKFGLSGAGTGAALTGSPLVSDGQLAAFVAFLASLLRAGRCFELVQAYLHVFLNVCVRVALLQQSHADVIVQQPGLTDSMRALQALEVTGAAHSDTQRAEWARLEGLFQQVGCLATFLGGTF